ncbi:anaphase-promoting complex subunit 8 isoform X4 [Daucus carota subsp. sativus]|uniref:anaphase-promoting complex subunit 8 isoform X4 n=1 Tax=Daucus carota subsp. sativus TaxID=79200 RepID=UPI0007EF4F60|nr:PREDICTED: anaphase-promoting complex subunit 8-like isoform X2 [Daucus carota subsp. sativus]
MVNKENYKSELRSAILHLNERGLYSASKWAAEQLMGIVMDGEKNIPVRYKYLKVNSSTRRRSRTDESPSTLGAGSNISTPVRDEYNDGMDNDYYLLAKSYFDCREYRRAAHVLRDQTGKRAIFLRCYSLYLAGEKRKEEENIELEGPLGKSDALNQELVLLESELSVLQKNGTIDSFGLYLYGLVLKEKGSANLARIVLVDSVNSYPWNWNACAYHELRLHNESLAKYEHLEGTFGYSNYIQAEIAKVRYSLREFDQVEDIFEELLSNDPYRVEDMDVYSNVLYARECFSALSYLAHKVFMTDKYRPESCCIIGNYYSLKGQHEKSVMYFRRALKLNNKYLSAWTLMGHEYVEMKNTAAAVDAYRRAVDISPCDYRAWYGLGQAYEMMGMPLYALHYFKKSVFLQPNDSRLWIAMAQCYESDQLHMIEEAIKCYRRATNCNDSEAMALHHLAKLHAELGRSEEAAYYNKKYLEMMEDEEREGPDMVKALMFLAQHCKEQKRLEEAAVYCTRLLDYTGPEREQAKNLLRGIRLEQSSSPAMDIDQFPLE